MRFNDIKTIEESELFEVNMSPGNLQKLANQIDARAGMEFEMVVPGITTDTEPEPDYDYDEPATSWGVIEEFFDQDMNSTREVRDLIANMQEEFYSWANEELEDKWNNNVVDQVYEWAVNNVSDDEVRSELNLDDDHEITKDDWGAYTDQCIESTNNTYEEAREEFLEDERNRLDEYDWLRRNYPHMSDIANSFTITWPIWSSGGGDADIEGIADEFENAIGKPVHWSTNYHGAERSEDAYSVEPDGSINTDDDDEAGIEFISPPMSVSEMFDDLGLIRTWAKRRGCYTNTSTGLHMNVSVPSWSGNLEKLDYVKLALLLGDEYVLKQFGRLGNTYTASAMEKLRRQVTDNPENVVALLKQMKTHLADAATKIIHSGVTSKYTSINVKDGYIEFRSPGGNWLADLQHDPVKIKNTLLRFVVALDAAVDPVKYREEYLKKLYKLLGAKTDGSKDTIGFFADYVAGKMPRVALKSFIKQAQLERNIKAGKTGGQADYWWEVWRDGEGASNGPGVEVVAKTKEEALAKAATEFGLDSPKHMPAATARPIRPYSTAPVTATAGEPRPGGRPGSIQYELYNRQTDTAYRTFWAADDQMAIEIGNRYRDSMAASAGIARSQLGLRRVAGQQVPTDLSPQAPTGDQNTSDRITGNWLIKDSNTGQILHRFGGVYNVQAAANLAVQWVREHGPEDAEFEIEVVPDQGRPQQPNAQRELRGWKIVLPDGREVHQFAGIGNNQGDANRIASEWLRNNGYGVSGEGYEVVPVWG
jgi:hypothetical protein